MLLFSAGTFSNTGAARSRMVDLGVRRECPATTQISSSKCTTYVPYTGTSLAPFYTSDMTTRFSYNSSQTALAFRPSHPTSSYYATRTPATTRPNPSGGSFLGMSPMHATIQLPYVCHYPPQVRRRWQTFAASPLFLAPISAPRSTRHCLKRWAGIWYRTPPVVALLQAAPIPMLWPTCSGADTE